MSFDYDAICLLSYGGPRGPQDVLEAVTREARQIVAEGIATPEQVERHRRLAAADHHPAVIVVERVGASILAAQAREIVRQAQMRPPEGDLQVLILTEFHLVTVAAPMLLKSIEEPGHVRRPRDKSGAEGQRRQRSRVFLPKQA